MFNVSRLFQVFVGVNWISCGDYPFIFLLFSKFLIHQLKILLWCAFQIQILLYRNKQSLSLASTVVYVLNFWNKHVFGFVYFLNINIYQLKLTRTVVTSKQMEIIIFCLHF